MPINDVDIKLNSDNEIDINETLRALLCRRLGVSVDTLTYVGMNVDADNKLALEIHALDPAVQDHMLKMTGLNAGPYFDCNHVNRADGAGPPFSIIRITSAEAILSMFRFMEYDSLLSDVATPLFYQRDLLQLLLSQTVRQIIKKHVTCFVVNSSHSDFNTDGQLSVRLSLNQFPSKVMLTAKEFCVFIAKYGDGFKVTKHFYQLLESQVYITKKRQWDTLQQMTATGFPVITDAHYVSDVSLLSEGGAIALRIERREEDLLPASYPVLPLKAKSSERRLLKQILSESLGEHVELKWRIVEANYCLVLRSKLSSPSAEQLQEMCETFYTTFNAMGLLNDEIMAQQEGFTKRLLAPNDAVDLAPSIKASTSDDIIKLLVCPITCDVSDNYVITPEGQSFDREALMQWLAQSQTNPVTQSPLAVSELRSNALLAELVAYYQTGSTAVPDCLKNMETGKLYSNPTVDYSGITRDQKQGEHLYLDRSAKDVISMYNGVFSVRSEAIVREGVRKTIAANIAVLCPGPGSLSDDLATVHNELPYIVYDTGAESLLIDFITDEYAERFKAAFSHWLDSNDLPSDSIQSKASHRVIKKGEYGYQRECQFTFQLIISGRDIVSRFIQDVCLLPHQYFELLVGLTDEEDMFPAFIFNEGALADQMAELVDIAISSQGYCSYSQSHQSSGAAIRSGRVLEREADTHTSQPVLDMTDVMLVSHFLRKMDPGFSRVSDKNDEGNRSISFSESELRVNLRMY